MYTERDQYHSIQSDLLALIGEWEDSKATRDKQIELSVIATVGAIVSIASGGSLNPAAYVITVATAKAEHVNHSYNVNSLKYLDSMSNLLSLMDTACSNVGSAYNSGYLNKKPPGSYVGFVYYLEHTPGYVTEYDAYLSMAVDHLNAHEYTGERCLWKI